MTLPALPVDPGGEPADAVRSEAEYAPFGLAADPGAFGLVTRRICTRQGLVTVRTAARGTGSVATVLLHGAAGSWTTWTPLLAAAAARGQRLDDLVLVDLPGWGDSPWPDRPISNGRDAHSVEAYAITVADVARRLGYRSWRLVGHSLGGFIALHLAAIEPQRTHTVGLVSPTAFAVAEVARHPVRRWRHLSGFAGLALVMRVFSGAPSVATAALRMLRRLRLLRAAVSPLFAHPELVPDSVLEAFVREIRPAAFTRAVREAAAYDLAGSWGRIVCPVRSVHGAHDVFVGAGDDPALAGAIRDFSVVEVPAAGHFAQIESPAAVLDALSDSFSPRS